MARKGAYLRGEMPLDVSGEPYFEALYGDQFWSDPEALYVIERSDVQDLVKDRLGDALIGDVDLWQATGCEEIDEFGDCVDETDDFEGKYEVSFRTRSGEVGGAGSTWLEATLRAIAAWQEIRRRSTLEIKMIEQASALDFVEMYHRHHERPVGSIFNLGAFADVNGEMTWVGVAVVGRAVNRWLDLEGCWEVTRMAVWEHGHSYLSQLYARAWEETKKRGGKRLITYIRADESGQSLRANYRPHEEMAALRKWLRAHFKFQPYPSDNPEATASVAVDWSTICLALQEVAKQVVKDNGSLDDFWKAIGCDKYREGLKRAAAKRKPMTDEERAEFAAFCERTNAREFCTWFERLRVESLSDLRSQLPIGWHPTQTVKGRSWDAPGRRREDRTEIIDRIRWEILEPDYTRPTKAEMERLNTEAHKRELKRKGRT